MTPTPPPVLPRDGTYAAIAIERYVQMWKDPEKPSASFTYDARNPFGKVSPLLVDDSMRDTQGRGWLRVLLPMRPNGRAAWVREQDVRLVRRDERILVDLSERTLERFRHGTLVDRFSVAIGSPTYPTATGTFSVWIKVDFADPSGPYGVYALGLSGFSPVLSDWPGGGRMAIHGTPYASNRGQAVSHGCVRVYNPDMQTLRDVPMGTPVIIRR